MTWPQRIWVVFQKCFRGLIAEEKGGYGWELSKGSVAFWIVLAHCMHVWNKIDPSAGGKMDVSEGELYTLWALVGYAGVKVGSGMIKDTVASWKGTDETKP